MSLENAAANEGYKMARGVIAKNISTDEVNKYYKTWAENYDRDIGSIQYPGPRMVAEFVLQFFPENKDIRILDVAGGTGLGAIELIKRGYSNLDCVDASGEMLEKAKEKNVYRNMYQAFLGPNQITAISSDTYDLIVTCGSFTEGHVNQSCFPELLRVVKPGGHILILMGEHYLQSVDIYRDKLEPAMDELEKEGRWTKVTRQLAPGYAPVAAGSTGMGVLFIFRKS